MKRVTLLFLCLALLLPLFARGEEAYASYTTNAWGEAVPAPASYRVRSVLTGEMMGAGRLNKPQDLFYDAARDEVYLADTGNSRVVVLDSSLSFLREYTSAGDKPFVTPSGVFVRADGLIYVADEGAGAVLCLEPRGALVREYTRPVSDLYEEDMPYRPQKVVVDSAGRGMSVSMIETVGQQIARRYAELAETGLKAGAPATLRVFN